MNIFPQSIQYDSEKYLYNYQELIFDSGGSTPENILGSAALPLLLINPSVSPLDQLKLIIPGNIADQTNYNYNIRFDLQLRAIVTGTGAANTYIGPFSVPVNVISYGNITGLPQSYIVLDGGQPLQVSFMPSNPIVELNNKISFLQFNNAIAVKLSTSMDTIIQNAYFIPDIAAGDWSIEAIGKIQIQAIRKH